MTLAQAINEALPEPPLIHPIESRGYNRIWECVPDRAVYTVTDEVEQPCLSATLDAVFDSTNDQTSAETLR